MANSRIKEDLMDFTVLLLQQMSEAKNGNHTLKGESPKPMLLRGTSWLRSVDHSAGVPIYRPQPKDAKSVK